LDFASYFAVHKTWTNKKPGHRHLISQIGSGITPQDYYLLIDVVVIIRFSSFSCMSGEKKITVPATNRTPNLNDRLNLFQENMAHLVHHQIEHLSEPILQLSFLTRDCGSRK
jgi:hypothetical protein